MIENFRPKSKRLKQVRIPIVCARNLLSLTIENSKFSDYYGNLGVIETFRPKSKRLEQITYQ